MKKRRQKKSCHTLHMWQLGERALTMAGFVALCLMFVFMCLAASADCSTYVIIGIIGTVVTAMIAIYVSNNIVYADDDDLPA